LRGIDATLQIGDQKYQSGAEFEMNGHPTKLLVFARGASGGTLTITADAELEPGVDLSRLRWRLVQRRNGSTSSDKTVMEGTFESGLVQTLTIPSELWNTVWTVQVRVAPEPLELRLQLPKSAAPPRRFLDPTILWE
jgi:hypothetical protein